MHSSTSFVPLSERHPHITKESEETGNIRSSSSNPILDRMIDSPSLKPPFLPFTQTQMEHNIGSQPAGLPYTSLSLIHLERLPSALHYDYEYDGYSATQMRSLAAKARASKLAAEVANAELAAARAEEEYLEAVERARHRLRLTISQRQSVDSVLATSPIRNGHSLATGPSFYDAALTVEGHLVPQESQKKPLPAKMTYMHGCIPCKVTSKEVQPARKRAEPENSSCVSSSDLDSNGNNPTHHKRAKKNIISTSNGKSGRTPKDQSSPSNDPKQKQPRLPLSAYIFYVMCERQHVVEHLDKENPPPFTTFKPFEEIVKDLPTTQGRKRRKHRFVHGKISFIELSKLMSKRWRNMPKEQVNYYKDLAEKDKERYYKEMGWKGGPLSSSGKLPR